MVAVERLANISPSPSKANGTLRSGDFGWANYGPHVPDGEQTELLPMNSAPALEQLDAFASSPQMHPTPARSSQQFPALAGGDPQAPVMQSHTVPAAPGVPLKLMQSAADGS